MPGLRPTCRAGLWHVSRHELRHGHTLDSLTRMAHGLAHDGTEGPGRNFERYWRAVARPADGPEERLVERLALAQIWPRLTSASRNALTALAVYDDHQRAAAALGISYKAFVSRISEGRSQFLALWHDGETPSRPWVRDRRAGPGTDMHTAAATEHKRVLNRHRQLLIAEWKSRRSASVSAARRRTASQG